PQRRTGATWSNDFLAFNASGDLLAVYYVGGDVEVIELTQRRPLWWHEKAITCMGASVKFDETAGVLKVFDYVAGLTINYQLRLSDGVNLLENWEVVSESARVDDLLI